MANEKVGEAYLELTAKDGKLKTSLSSSEKEVSSFVSRAQAKLTQFGKIAFAGAIAGFTALTAIIIKATKAAAAEQLQTAQLYHQLGMLGVNTAATRDEIERLANIQQKYTRFGDTQTRAMLAQLLMLTGDYEKSIKNLALAQDMAESGMFDEQSAARYLGMALQGNIEMLGRYIPELKTTTNESLKNMSANEKAAFAVELLTNKFGGLAKQIGDTSAGAWAKFKNAVSDAWEALGKGSLDEIASGFSNITDKVKELEPALEKVGRWLGKLVKAGVHAVGVFAEVGEALLYAANPSGYIESEERRAFNKRRDRFLQQWEDEKRATVHAEEEANKKADIEIAEEKRKSDEALDIVSKRRKSEWDEFVEKIESEEKHKEWLASKRKREEQKWEGITLDPSVFKPDKIQLPESKLATNMSAAWKQIEQPWMDAMLSGQKDLDVQRNNYLEDMRDGIDKLVEYSNVKGMPE